MLLDTTVEGPLSAAAATARAAEAAGFDTLWATETSHDPFLPLLLAAEHTDRIEVGTGIAVAFARNPMTLAATAWDLQAAAQGRFILGLGSQVKPHIERRFSMPWGQPAARMREMVQAIRAIWATWQDDVPLDFRGDFYTHTIMTPFFNPGPIGWGPPRIVIAAVGEAMTRVAGEVGDGLLVHPFTTERYVRDVTLPLVGGTREGFELILPVLVASGATDEEMATAVAGVRKQIAFYGSTPAYRGVFEVHGWGDLQPELTRLSKDGAWDEMGTLITDDVLHAFAVVAEPEQVADRITERFGDVVHRVRLYRPYDCDPAPLAALVGEAFRSARGA